MKKNFQYIILFVFLIGSQAKGQKKMDPGTITISAAPGQPIPDSVTVRFYRGILDWSNKFIIQKTIKKVNLNNAFKFDIPIGQPLSPFTIFLHYKWDITKSIILYAQPSDQIEAIITKTTGKVQDGPLPITFSGKGSLKYKVDYTLSKMNGDRQAKVYALDPWAYLTKLKIGDYYNSAEFKTFLLKFYQINRFEDIRVNDTLSKYKNRLGAELTDFYRHEVGHNLTFVGMMQLAIDSTKADLGKKSLADFYFSKIDSLRPEFSSNNPLLKFGIHWRSMLSYYVGQDLYFKNNGMHQFNVEYDEIKKLKNKEFRDIITTRLFFKGARNINITKSRDSCLLDALSIIKNSELRSELIDQLLFNKGSKMTDFTFIDTLGNKLGLKDMIGKVYILDFYYYGCVPCAEFAKRFKDEIFPNFEHNPNFKVLSVNPVNTKEYWLKGIKSGLYTLPASINLTTGVEFEKYPLFKKYSITGLPWVLLIDKNGRVIDFKLQKKSTLEIKEMIQLALNENASNE